MKSFWQIIATIWFAILTAGVLIPGISLLYYSRPEQEIKSPPPYPPAPMIASPPLPGSESAQVEIYKLQVAAYTHQVSAYTQQVSAYKEEVTAYNIYASHLKNTRSATYSLVVKDTLIPLLTAFLTALLSFVFVREGRIALGEYWAYKGTARYEK